MYKRQPEMSDVPPGAGIEVKTKFPVARIKRIMQADEDVGKVAQVTPIAVCMYFSIPHAGRDAPHTEYTC